MAAKHTRKSVGPHWLVLYWHKPMQVNGDLRIPIVENPVFQWIHIPPQLIFYFFNHNSCHFKDTLNPYGLIRWTVTVNTGTSSRYFWSRAELGDSQSHVYSILAERKIFCANDSLSIYIPSSLPSKTLSGFNSARSFIALEIVTQFATTHPKMKAKISSKNMQNVRLNLALSNWFESSCVDLDTWEQRRRDRRKERGG